VPTATATTTRVPMQAAAGGEFLSPSGNISCEVGYHRAGPFRCESAGTGITCVAGGKGFRISTSGAMPVPA
jgi:hypothetical protein